jgi:hypothetical protein
MNAVYLIREYAPEDKNFICATFLRGLYHGDSWFSLMPRNIFMTNYHKVIEALIDSPNVLIRIAALTEDPSVILGYSLLSKDGQTLPWVYVKSSKSQEGSWRMHGIGKALVTIPTLGIEPIKQVTHLTTLGKELLPKLKNPIFNPFAF